MVATIILAYRPTKVYDKDITIKSTVNLHAEDNAPKVDDAVLKKSDVEGKKGETAEVKTEVKDEKGLLTSGQRYTVTYKYGTGKDTVEKTADGTIADPKGISYLAIDI